ncbi:MAG TPA: transposase [Gaiellaceae bacterium]|nr:transposase [Gaiellaceae bacterium]
MARRLRIQAAGIRHVTCRGNRRQAIFRDALDRGRYLGLFAEVCSELGWRALTWCLMGNHVHLVMHVPDDTISNGMQWLSGDYAAGFNRRHGLDGHLFQGRFRDELVLDERYLWTLLPYVDLNPVRAARVRRAQSWRWSGCRALLGMELPRPFHDVERVWRLLRRDPLDAQIAYGDLLANWRLADERRSRAGASTAAMPGV